MGLKLHHVNFSTDRVEEMDSFYREVMGLDTCTTDLPALEKTKGYNGDVAFVWDGAVQVHLARKDVHAAFKTGQSLNPLERGHVAFRTDDLAGFKAQLDEKGIPYANWGNAAVQGWNQIFFYDPDGNIIEVHEVAE